MLNPGYFWQLNLKISYIWQYKQFISNIKEVCFGPQSFSKIESGETG